MSLFTPCTESVVVTCTQCTSVTIYTVHRVCCGDMYPVYQCHYLHRAQSLLSVTCTQCTSVTIYTVHRVCCGDMYPVYQCHYLHRAQSLVFLFYGIHVHVDSVKKVLLRTRHIVVWHFTITNDVTFILHYK